MDNEQTPPAQAALEDAIAAVSRAITETLRSEEACRFSRVTELCAIGKGLLRMRAKTVEDFEALENPAPNDGLYANNFNIGGGLAQPYVAMPPPRQRRGGIVVDNGAVVAGAGIFGRQDDPHEQNRLLGLALGVEGPLGAAIHAQQREREAGELRHLVEVEREMPHKEVQDRIRKILSEMEKRNGQADDLVHAEFLRGHSHGGDSVEPDAIACVRPDIDGAPGNGAAPLPGAAVVAPVGVRGRV